MNALVFYDGDCGFCNSFIHYLAKHNEQQQLKFASLDGKLAREKLPENLMNVNSIVVVFGGCTFIYSRAVCVALSQSRSFIAPFATWALWLMGPHTDFVYQFVAKYRRKLPRSRSCGILTSEEIKAFI